MAGEEALGMTSLVMILPIFIRNRSRFSEDVFNVSTDGEDQMKHSKKSEGLLNPSADQRLANYSGI